VSRPRRGEKKNLSLREKKVPLFGSSSVTSQRELTEEDPLSHSPIKGGGSTFPFQEKRGKNPRGSMLPKQRRSGPVGKKIHQEGGKRRTSAEKVQRERKAPRKNLFQKKE